MKDKKAKKRKRDKSPSPAEVEEMDLPSEEEPRPKKKHKLTNGHSKSKTVKNHIDEDDVQKIPQKLLEGVDALQASNSLSEDSLNYEDLADPETEVWVIKCQKDVDIQAALVGNRINLREGRSSVGTGFEMVCVPNQDTAKNVNMILPSVQEYAFKMASKPLQGTLLLQESIQEIEYPEFPQKKKKKHKLPKNLKERHAIYGVGLSHVVESKSDRKKKKKSQKEYS